MAKIESTQMTAVRKSDLSQPHALQDQTFAPLEVVTGRSLPRVLFIAHDFPPCMSMGSQSCSQIARYLPDYGWSPIVLTIDKRHVALLSQEHNQMLLDWEASGTVVRTGILPHPFDFYRLVKSVFTSDPKAETSLTSTSAASTNNLVLNHKSGIRGWLLSILLTPDVYTGWLIPAVLAGLRLIRSAGIQMIFSSAPYWTNHLVGYFLARISGLPWIAHFRDPWATGGWDNNVTSGVSGKINRLMERMTVTCSSAVVAVTAEHTAILRTSYPQLPSTKFVTVLNGFDGAEWEGLAEKLSSDIASVSPGKFRITYTGNLYIQRNPHPLFRALRDLIDQGEIDGNHVQFDLIGWCEICEDRSIYEFISEAGLNGCVSIIGPLPRGEALRQMAQSTLLLLLAEDLALQIPGKTFEYLKAGRPILALTSEGAVANLIRQTGGGWAVDPNDHSAIVSAVRECYQAWRDGRAAYVPDPTVVERFDRRITTQVFAEIFDSLRQQNNNCR